MVVGKHSSGIRGLCEARLVFFVSGGVLFGSTSCQPGPGSDRDAAACRTSASNCERGDCECRDSGAPNLADTTHGGPDGGEGIEADTGGDNGSPPAHQVELPVEVIGPDGYTQTVEVGVEQTADVETLELRTYSIGLRVSQTPAVVFSGHRRRKGVAQTAGRHRLPRGYRGGGRRGVRCVSGGGELRDRALNRYSPYGWWGGLFESHMPRLNALWAPLSRSSRRSDTDPARREGRCAGARPLLSRSR